MKKLLLILPLLFLFVCCSQDDDQKRDEPLTCDCVENIQIDVVFEGEVVDPGPIYQVDSEETDC